MSGTVTDRRAFERATTRRNTGAWDRVWADIERKVDILNHVSIPTGDLVVRP